ncbi:MAG: DUF2155 domain-containing protein [Pseudomonadota bacterium]
MTARFPLCLAVVMIFAGQGALAQTDPGGFVITPLDPLDPADPADPTDPTDPADEGGLGIAIAPEIGLQQTPIPDPDSGFVDGDGTEDGTFIQVNPGGQDGVALVTTRNTSAASSETRVAAEAAGGATLRALDKSVGQTTDIEMRVGEAVIFGSLAIRLLDCRFPADNPASDAFAQVRIADLEGRQLFEGWMIASSPALVALEHPRYDVWVLGCSTS